MKSFVWAACIFVTLNCLADGLPSSRDKLLEDYRGAKGEYSKSQKDLALFLKAVERLCGVGASIVQANTLPIKKTNVATYRTGPWVYPIDARKEPGKSSYDSKMNNLNNILKSFNEKINSFEPPTTLTPEDIRNVDQYIRTLGEAIEAHHNACLNIRH